MASTGWRSVLVAAVLGCLLKLSLRNPASNLIEKPLRIPFVDFPLTYFTPLGEPAVKVQVRNIETHRSLDPDYSWASGLTWSAIEPASALSFHPCYDGFECARLKLPMDWMNEDVNTANDTIALAVLRLPAKVPLMDPRHGGVVVIETGGPGASGVDFLRKGGREHQTVVDAAYSPDSQEGKAADAKFYDLIAIDPRGIKRSTPFHTCFKDPHARLTWDAHLSSLVPGGPEFNVAVELARQQAVYETCSYDGTNSEYASKISSYMGTASVARDLVELLERYGQWREAEAKRLRSKATGEHANWRRWQQGKEPLRYWGLSYGTVVGSAFASMYPERVERMVLDGVVDTHDDYWQGRWLHSVSDTDALMSRFFENCASAGSADCAMNLGDDTPATIQERWLAIEAHLYNNGPIPVPAGPNNTADVITWSDFRNAIWTSSYEPLTKWEGLAEILGPLAKGNGTAFAKYKQGSLQKLKHVDVCPVIDPNNPDCALDNYNHRYVWAAVQCADSEDESSTVPSRELFDAYYSSVTEQSFYLGAQWSTLRWVCLGWKGRTTFKPSLPIGEDRLKHPILFVSNTLDNVTPLRNAYTMKERFPGSQVLEIDAEGHCLLSGPSLCAVKTVREYFQKGTLPESGKRCLPIERPLLGTSGDDVELLGELSAEEKQLLDAAKSLKKSVND